MSRSTVRHIIFSTVLVVIAAGAFSFMVYQVLLQGEQLTAQVITLEEEESQKSTYRHLLRTSEETAAERAELKSHFLLQESDSIDFLNKVEGMAPRSGVKLQTEGLELIKDEADGTEWIQVKFTFSGSREQVQNFVQVLETLPYVSRLTTVELESLSATEWKASVTMRVRVLSYDK